MPVMAGSITLRIATAVTAASAAFPPWRNTSTAAALASGCEVATMPSVAMVGERPGKWKSRVMLKLRRPERSGDRPLALDRDVALGRADPDRIAADHIDEGEHHHGEEGRGRSQRH